MDFMEKLLDGVEVEWKTLGEVGEFVRGNGLQKSDFAESGVGCIHYGQIYTYKIHNDYIYDFVFDDGHIQNIYLVCDRGRFSCRT